MRRSRWAGDSTRPSRPRRATDGALSQHSPAAAKIALFRSLFRGRDDVYPRRFESRKTGKSGYAPACANEWVRGICEKPRIKCAECPHRRFLPVTDDVIRWHLSGRDAGISRSSLASTRCCWTRRASFWPSISTRTDWEDDALAFVHACRRLGPARRPRALALRTRRTRLVLLRARPFRPRWRAGSASHLLTETMEDRPDIGLDSYDRLFPNQDTLPQGGFGNLIALPLQKRAARTGQQRLPRRRPACRGRTSGRSWRACDASARAEVEADRAGRGTTRPHSRRSAAAATTRTTSRGRRHRRAVDTRAAARRRAARRAWNWSSRNQIYIAKEGLHPGLRNRLLRLAAFQNPEFYKAQAMRLSTYDKPRVIACAEDHPQHIGLPRGCLDDVRDTLSRVWASAPSFATNVSRGQRHRRVLPRRAAARAAGRGHGAAAHDTGVLAATTAFGKTVSPRGSSRSAA